MKIKIKNKLLTESDGKFPTTSRYKQVQSRRTDGNVVHASEDVQVSRMEIAMNIDRFLQRPFVTVGEEILDDNDEMITITDAKDTNLLYYVYKGVDDNKQIMNKNDVAAVNRELNQRVYHFLESLDPMDKKVLASDIDYIITQVMSDRGSKPESTHVSSYMLKTAPGEFDDFVFGARRRSVYQDTRAGKDFMLKRTPELKNIPPEHHFLFSMENLMGRVKQALNMKPDPDVPKLDGASYDANYRLGVTTEYIQDEEKFMGKDEKSLKTLNKTTKRFFLTYFSNPSMRQDISETEEFEILAPWFEILLVATKKKLEANELPEEFVEFLKLYQQGKIPAIYIDEYEEVIESYIEPMQERGYLGDF